MRKKKRGERDKNAKGIQLTCDSHVSHNRFIVIKRLKED